ncbi:ion channel [Paracoccus sp. Z330]|uniref:Ion channel n=1 Tax=Paracoccus onchidii TaxID=3017813 RepID=A0ABT4ZBF2_9RHOB|nr:ion channel [Paracoccus onchidii]MDB6176695.1 ion channel [Paracoccus onchidii]
MLGQIVLGGLLVMLCSTVAGSSAMAMLAVLGRRGGWLTRGRQNLKMVLGLILCTIWALMVVTISVGIWAGAFVTLDLFPTLEEAVYFSLVVFTTLGFGDLLLPPEWRILGGVMAVNGLLNVGILTAVIMEVLRNLRARQKETE